MVLQYREFIQFRKKIRDTYINGKTVNDLIKIVKIMRSEDKMLLSSHAKKHEYTLGSTLYIIDIRFNTFYKSQRSFPNNENQWFGPKHLAEVFSEIDNIEYIYCQDLGNPKKFRDECIGDPDENKELYLSYLQKNNEDFQPKTAFENLYNLVDKKHPHVQVCLLCYCEPKKEACHRFWLIEALLKRKYEELRDTPLEFEYPHYFTVNRFEDQLKMEESK